MPTTFGNYNFPSFRYLPPRSFHLSEKRTNQQKNQGQELNLPYSFGNNRKVENFSCEVQKSQACFQRSDDVSLQEFDVSFQKSEGTLRNCHGSILKASSPYSATSEGNGGFPVRTAPQDPSVNLPPPGFGEKLLPDLDFVSKTGELTLFESDTSRLVPNTGSTAGIQTNVSCGNVDVFVPSMDEGPIFCFLHQLQQDSLPEMDHPLMTNIPSTDSAAFSSQQNIAEILDIVGRHGNLPSDPNWPKPETVSDLTADEIHFAFPELESFSLPRVIFPLPSKPSFALDAFPSDQSNTPSSSEFITPSILPTLPVFSQNAPTGNPEYVDGIANNGFDTNQRSDFFPATIAFGTCPIAVPVSVLPATAQFSQPFLKNVDGVQVCSSKSPVRLSGGTSISLFPKGPNLFPLVPVYDSIVAVYDSIVPVCDSVVPVCDSVVPVCDYMVPVCDPSPVSVTHVEYPTFSGNTMVYQWIGLAVSGVPVFACAPAVYIPPAFGLLWACPNMHLTPCVL